MSSISLTCCLLVLCIGALNGHDVAFSAAKGPYQYHSARMVYNYAYLNTGRGYNCRTGIFRAPRTGLYSFTYNFLTYPKHAAYMYLYKNNAIVARSYAYNCYGYANGGNTANLFLHRGNRVWTRNVGYIHGGYYTTFNGFMISSYSDETDKTASPMDETSELNEEAPDQDIEPLNQDEN